jgi:hypothetical protein
VAVASTRAVRVRILTRPGQTLIGGKNYFGREFEAQLH